MMNKILLVDDEKDIVEFLKYNLEKENDFKVIAALNGKEAIEMAKIEKPSLIVLDIMMPGLNGFDVCKILKTDPGTSLIPVIFLTAKEDEIDEIIGFELGADDYIHKPISPRKVIARIKSVIRRTNLVNETEKNADEYIKFEDLEIDTVAHTVRIDGENIFFPRKEFRILHFLLSNKDILLSREVLLTQVWGENNAVFDRTIDVHIGNIRAKLGRYSKCLETIKGVGILFKTK
jgi:two-component system alkaline phosphatase synthesis response regulator PhoP